MLIPPSSAATTNNNTRNQRSGLASADAPLQAPAAMPSIMSPPVVVNTNIPTAATPMAPPSQNNPVERRGSTLGYKPTTGVSFVFKQPVAPTPSTSCSSNK
eukprot:UN10423